jgi:fibro-slime domain-containing protein
MVLSGIVGTACSPGETGSSVGSEGGSSSSQGGAGGHTFTLDQGGQGGAVGAGGSGTTTAATWPPKDFTNVTSVSIGDYALGPPTSTLTSTGGQSGSGGDSSACAGLFGVVRDFKMGNLSGGHPDFQLPTPGRAAEKGIVESTLENGKPKYAHGDGTTATTSGQTNFNQWYNDVEGTNMSYVVALRFLSNPAAGNGVVTFSASINNSGKGADGGAKVADSSYFPLDGAGWDDEARADDGKQHNFAFTTELHTSFTYNGGETFTFDGDDDVWVFINNKLAIDLGGIHEQLTASVNLDAQADTLGIEKGNSYELAVFNAERHTTQSNFRIDTTMVFTNCGKINGIIY